MVIWSEEAKRDLRGIYDYIARESKIYAQQVADNVVAQSMDVDKMPRRYRMMPELEDDAVREFSIYSYRVIFEIMTDHIYVLAVAHKRQNIMADDINSKREQ